MTVIHDREHFEAMSCPASVTWTNDIKQMFNATDIAHMKSRGLDLTDYMSVKISAVQIYTKTKNGTMPPPGSGDRWSTEKVDLFGCWIQHGTPEN